MSESSIVLLAPPVLGCTTGPFLGIANLKAYLKDHTRYPVHLLDWNVECLLSRQFFEMLEEYLCFLQCELADSLPNQYFVLLQQVKAICADFHNPGKLGNKVTLLQVLFQKLLLQRNFRDTLCDYNDETTTCSVHSDMLCTIDYIVIGGKSCRTICLD